MTQFSIIVTAHNQEHFITNAVDSALSQNYTSKEVIVVDDASRDGTKQILAQYGNQIQLIQFTKNQGANAARNAGASVAKGQYLVFLDGDDLLLPWALDVYARVVDSKKPTVILCRLLFFTGAIPTPRFDDFGQGLQVVEYDALIRKDRSYRDSASALVVERQVFDDVGGWADIFPLEVEDLTMKLGYSGRTIHIVSHPTAAYRLHATNVVHQVHRIVDTMHLIIGKEKRGQYPGGKRFRSERRAFIGGPVCYWVTRAFGTGLYWRAAKLLASGWLMILAAIIYRLKIKIRGRRPLKTIEM